MKIVLISESVREGWAQTFKRSFEQLGHSVTIVDDQEIYRTSSRLARNRYLHHLLWRVLASFAQPKMLSAVVREKPDLILIFKGWLWQPRTLRALKTALPQMVLMNYNPDSPFNRELHGNANNWIRKSIPIFDAYFIWSRELVKKIKEYGARRSEYLACGYDPELHSPVFVTPAEAEHFGSDVAFVGSWDKEREDWIRALLDYKIRIWGNSWEKAAPDVRAVWTGTAAVGEDFSKVCAASKIILDFLRLQNRSSHNMKTFEIPAAKGFMLSERSAEQQGLFEEGKEAAYFTGKAELRQKIDHYLPLAEERQKIANAGYTRLVAGKNSYTDRCQRILEVYNELAQR
jgi:spore maturation protein CgeB